MKEGPMREKMTKRFPIWLYFVGWHWGLNYSAHCKSQGKHWDQCDLLGCKLSNSPTFIYSTGFAYSEKPASCNSLFAESNGKSTFQQD